MALQTRAEQGNSSCGIDSVARVYDSGDELVVLIRLKSGLLELRTPRGAVVQPEGHRHPAINPDATPC